MKERDSTRSALKSKQECVASTCSRYVIERGVESDKVLQTVKTDMVKHDVEVESSGKCVDEIDKLAELIGKHEADQHW
ncbi:hypothetical protein Tco_0141600 [Tanacetum coccineum]